MVTANGAGLPFWEVHQIITVILTWIRLDLVRPTLNMPPGKWAELFEGVAANGLQLKETATQRDKED